MSNFKMNFFIKFSDNNISDYLINGNVTEYLKNKVLSMLELESDIDISWDEVKYTQEVSLNTSSHLVEMNFSTDNEDIFNKYKEVTNS